MYKVNIHFISLQVCILYFSGLFRCARAELRCIMQDVRKTAQFTQYALAAAEEALRDANWLPTSHEQREATVNSPLRDIRRLMALTWT